MILTIMYLGMCLIMVLVRDCMSALYCDIHSGREKMVPEDVECSCKDGDQEIFIWSLLDDLKQQTTLNKILLTKCSKLHIVLQPPHPNPIPQLIINNMDEVLISLSKDMPHPNITMTNVKNVQYSPMEKEEDNVQNMLVYVALAVGVVLVIVLSVFLVVLLWTR